MRLHRGLLLPILDQSDQQHARSPIKPRSITYILHPKGFARGMHTGSSWDLTRKRARSDILPEGVYEDCVRERHGLCGKLAASIRVVFR